MGRCRSARSIAETSLAACFLSLTWMLFNMLFVATRSHPFLISLRTAAAVARFHAAHNEKMAHLRQGDSSFLAPHLRQRFSSLGRQELATGYCSCQQSVAHGSHSVLLLYAIVSKSQHFANISFASCCRLRPVTASCSRFRTKGRGLTAPPFSVLSLMASAGSGLSARPRPQARSRSAPRRSVRALPIR